MKWKISRLAAAGLCGVLLGAGHVPALAYDDGSGDTLASACPFGGGGPVAEYSTAPAAVSRAVKSASPVSYQGRGVYIQPGDRAWGRAGTTISVTKSKGTSFTAATSASATAEAGLIFTKASAQFGLTLTKGWTTDTSFSDSFAIPKGGKSYGWIGVGTGSYAVTSKVTYWNENCSTSTVTKAYIARDRDVHFDNGTARIRGRVGS